MKIFYLTAALVLLGSYSVVFAQGPYIYNYGGGVQTYTVPCGVDSVRIKAWGAGGGGGGADSNDGGPNGAGGNGGGGAFAASTVKVNGGDVLTIYVGGGGTGGYGCSTDTGQGFGGSGYASGGNGGKSGPDGCSGGGGGGGGSSAVYDITTSALLVAAAGGGGAGGGGGVSYTLGEPAGGGGQNGTPNIPAEVRGGETGANGNANGGAGGNEPGDGGGGGGGGGGATGGGTGGYSSGDSTFNYYDCGGGGGAGGNSFGNNIVNANYISPGDSTDPSLCSTCARGGEGTDNWNQVRAATGGNGLVIITPVGGGSGSLAVTVNPNDTIICAGNSVALLATGGVTYSWSPAAGLSDSTIANPVASPTLSTTYTVTAASGGCSGVDSVVVTITPGAAGQAGNIIPAIDSVCSGGSVNLSVVGSAGNLQWQSSSNGSSFTNIPGVVTDAYTAAGVTQTVYYRVVAGGQCSVDTGSAAVVFVNPIPVAGYVLATPDSFCAGGSSVIRSFGSTGNIQWQSSTNGTSFSDITGASNTIYTTSSLYQTTYFRMVATTNCGIDSSTAAVVKITPSPITGSVSVYPDTVCAGNPVKLTTLGGTGSIQWQSSSNGILFNDIAGASSSVYNTTPLTHTTYFRVEAGSSCGIDSSKSYPVQVMQVPVAGSLSASRDTICPNTLATLALAGNSIAAVWQSSKNIVTGFTNITGATGDSYKGILAQTTYFRAIVNNGFCADTSAVFTQYVAPSPIGAFFYSISGDTVTFNSDSSMLTNFYFWDFGDNNYSSDGDPVHVYDTSGVLDVCLTVRNKTNCNYTVCKNITIYPLGIQSITYLNGWNIYPNPFGNEIFLRAGNAGGRVERAEIYDLTGRGVFNAILPGNYSDLFSFDVSSLAKGMYFLRVSVNGVEYNEKMIKQ